MNFTVSTSIIATATGITNMGERWFKSKYLEDRYYEPFIKPMYRNERKRVFPFRYLLNRYAPMMNIIMKYFSCEGRLSRLYTYHIRLLMHFTRVKLLNIPYYLLRSIDKMAYIVQKREFD